MVAASTATIATNHGEGERGTDMKADGIILVHGGMHTAACWALVEPMLTLPSRAVDLPGRGSRPAELSHVTLDDCVAAVLEEADSAGFARFALVGHSLGGATISEVAYRHGERITNLVYVGAIVPPAGSSAATVMIGQDVSATDPFVVSDDFAKPAFGNDLSEEQWAAHAASLVPDAPGIMNGVISGLPAGIPITYVNMSDDVPVPPALADQMATNLGPDIERRTIKAGHTVMVSQPRALADIINASLASSQT
jgi:pimeloyl-ACP methyl ester carboxylesterase